MGRKIHASYGKPSFASVGFMLGTIAFAVLSFSSVLTVIREHKAPMNRWNYWSAVFRSGLHLLITVYLRVIGLRTWA